MARYHTWCLEVNTRSSCARVQPLVGTLSCVASKCFCCCWRCISEPEERSEIHLGVSKEYVNLSKRPWWLGTEGVWISVVGPSRDHRPRWFPHPRKRTKPGPSVFLSKQWYLNRETHRQYLPSSWAESGFCKTSHGETAWGLRSFCFTADWETANCVQAFYCVAKTGQDADPVVSYAICDLLWQGQTRRQTSPATILHGHGVSWPQREGDPGGERAGQ